MTNNDRDLFSQVISTGSRDHEIEVSLGSFSSLPNDALEDVKEVKLGDSTDYRDQRQNGDQRHALSSSFESIEEESNNTQEPFLNPEGEAAADLDCMLAEAEGELMALLGGSVTKYGDASDHAANSNERESFEEKTNRANKLSGTAERSDSITQSNGNETVDASSILVSGDASEPGAFSDESAGAFVQQLTPNDQRSIPDTSEPGILITEGKLGHGLQLANGIKEKSLATGKEPCTVLDEEKVALCPIHTNDAALNNANTFMDCSDVEKSVSPTGSTMLFSDKSSSAIETEVTTSGVDDFDVSEGKPSSQQLHEMTSVQDIPSYESVDMLYKYTTSESDPLLHFASHAVGYDEEKKWDANSLSQSSVDPPNHYKEEDSMYNLNRKDSLEMTESDDSDHIFPRLDADCLTENTGRLLSGTDQKDRSNLRQQLTEEIAESTIDCDEIIRIGNDDLDTGCSTYEVAFGEGLYKQMENDARQATCDATRRSCEVGIDATPTENELLNSAVEASGHIDDQLRIAEEAPDLGPAAYDQIPGNADEGLDADQSENEVPDNTIVASEHCDDQLRTSNEALNTGSVCDATRCSFDDGLNATPKRDEVFDDDGEASELCDAQLRKADEAPDSDPVVCDETPGGGDVGLDAERLEEQKHDDIVKAPLHCYDILRAANEALDTRSACDESRCSFDDGIDAWPTINDVLEDVVEASDLCDVQLRMAKESLEFNRLAACDETPGSINEGLDASILEKEVHAEAPGYCDDNLQIANEALDFVQLCDEARSTLKAGLDARPTANEVLNDVVEASEQCDDLRIDRDESCICLAAQDATLGISEEGPHKVRSKHEIPADVVHAAKDFDQLPSVNEVRDIRPATCDEARRVLGDGLDATSKQNEMIDDVFEASEDCAEQLRIDKDESHTGLAAQCTTRGKREEESSVFRTNKLRDGDDAEAAKECDDQLRIANDDSLIGFELQELAPSSFEDRQGAHTTDGKDKTPKFIAEKNGVCEEPFQTAKESSNADTATCYTELDSFGIEQNVSQIENDEPGFIAEAFCCCINTSHGGNEDSDVDVLAYVAERENGFFDKESSGYHIDGDIGAASCDAEQVNREDGLNAQDFAMGRIKVRGADSTLLRASSCEIVVANRRCDGENWFSPCVSESLDASEVLIDKPVDAYEDDMDKQYAAVNEINVTELTNVSVIYNSDKAETSVTSIIGTKASRSEDEVDRSQTICISRITSSETDSLKTDGDKLRGPDRDSHAAILETNRSTGRDATPVEHLDYITRPPLFPHDRVDLHEDPDKLLSLLSSKLKSQKPAQTGENQVVMANNADKLFDPNLSVFAGIERDTYGALEISPPGSPISPSFFTEDDAFSSDESCSVPSLTALCSVVHPEISHWDMVPSGYTVNKNHPDLILTGDSVDGSESFVPDLRHNNADWTGTCALDLSFNEDKKTSASAPSGQTTSATGTHDTVSILSAFELAPSQQRTMVPTTSSSCPSSPHLYKDRSSRPFLLLSTSAEEKGFPDTNNRVRQTSELRRTLSLPNLQSLNSKPCASHCSSTSESRDEERLQLNNDSLISGDKEEKSDSHFVQTLDSTSKSPRRMHEELIRSIENLVSLHGCRDKSIRYMVSLHWKQLKAVWLHNEFCRPSFMNRQSTMHATISKSDENSYFNSVVTSHCMTVNSKIHDIQLFASQKCGSLSDSPACVNDLLRLCSFLSMDQTPESLLKQKILLEKGRETQALLATASSRISTFTEFVRYICGHLRNTDDATLDEVDSGIRYLVDVKTAHAIQSKAALKYDGDIMQVKDVLRAKIIFPNEAALICGLARLSQINDARGQSSTSEDHQTKFRVVRIKNLFYESSPTGGMVRSSLPTGYRHILVNVEMNDDFIAGKCIFLASFIYAARH